MAILPRIVPEEDLLSANSAMWVGETIADVIGYPLAGLFVALLGSAVPLAFWVDSATYLASAALLGTIVVGAAATRPGETDDGRLTDADRRPSIRAELAAGWQFLRHETVLLANTLQGAVGQFALGIVDRADPELRPGDLQPVRLRLAGGVRLPRDRARARATSSAGSRSG